MPVPGSKTQRRLLAAASAAAGAFFTYGRYVEPGRPVVERFSLPIADLPAQLDGTTIAHLTDFHYYPHTRLPYIKRVVQQVNRLQPDVIALTGDYINGNVGAVFDVAPVLAQLQAKHGVYAVLGNHDTSYFVPHTRVIVRYALNYCGIPLLDNEHVRLQNGLVIAGLDELYRGRPHLKDALAGVDDDAAVVLLVHQPDFADIAAIDRRVRLQLSGHTHGGQFILPKMRPLYLPPFGRKYVRGLFQIDQMWLYVNRGIGLSAYGPLRFRCPPEIALITLRRCVRSSALPDRR